MAGAIFQCSVKVISRKAGYSVLAAASYRSGERLIRDSSIVAKVAYDSGISLVYKGQVFDYRNKGKIGVVNKGIVYPPGEKQNWTREYLWNLVEVSEKRKDARLAREALVSFPEVLNFREREELTVELAGAISKRYGVVVDWAIHAPSKEGKNHHAHLLFTTRRLEGGQLTQKTRELDDGVRGPQEIIYIRKQWEQLVNQKLAAKGLDTRVSSDSLLGQGIEDRIPLNLSKEALNIEAKTGVKSEERLRWEQRQSEWDKIYPHLGKLRSLGLRNTVVGSFRVYLDDRQRLRIWQADTLILDYCPWRNIRKFALTQGFADFLELPEANLTRPWSLGQVIAARQALSVIADSATKTTPIYSAANNIAPIVERER